MDVSGLFGRRYREILGEQWEGKWENGDANKECVIKPVSTVGTWSAILLGTQGTSRERASEVPHPRGKGAGASYANIPSIVGGGLLLRTAAPWLCWVALCWQMVTGVCSKQTAFSLEQ